MFCSNCGKQLEDNVAFCPECGTKVAVAATPVVEEPAAPVAEAPVAPVVEEPAAPVAETPVAPVVEDPAAPVAETPVAPVVEKATETPAVSETPVEKKTEVPVTAPAAPAPQETKKKNKGPIIAIIILALLVIALGIAIWWLYNDKKQDKDDDWESTEAFADEDEDEDDDEEEEPTPEPTEEPTPEPTEEPTPEPTEAPTPEPTEAPTPEPTEEPEVVPTDDPEAEPTDDPEAEPTDDPEVEPSDDTGMWNDPVFDVDTSAYEKCTVYETEMDVSGMLITDTQTVLADGDKVAILIESTTIDLSSIPEDELSFYAEAYAETYDPLREDAPDSVEIVHGLDSNAYRFEMIIYLEDADLKELSEAGYISLTSGSADNILFISYEQTCAGLEAGGYTLVE